ncbi:MAG TPA: pyridoxal 5'-phosphate synthase glutaminase subunit PdxT [Solirubrobacteraceae bacterium]|nr:pyridoxal 5'-phosphate synthase glutaminase subunit PdxT [Solirubrobacteraceae bacterium]
MVEGSGNGRDVSPQAKRADGRVALVGILALQGDFEAHAKIIEALGHQPREVRVPADLEGLDGLIMPGGESTVMTLGIEREGLAEPIRELVGRGTPVLGTCAGLIMLDRNHLGVLDVVAARNAFGRQLHSFEADLEIEGIEGGPVHAVFIRAPWVAEHGAGVEVLARVDDHPVAIRQGNVVAISFHPELSGETRLHELALALQTPTGRPVRAT